jgi:hypothetical protein
VLKRAVTHENRAIDARTHCRYKESGKEEEKSIVGAVDEILSSDKHRGVHHLVGSYAQG